MTPALRTALTTAEYLGRAHEVADHVAAVASELEATGGRFTAEVELLRRSGLLSAVVPARLGGSDIAPSVVAEAVRILAGADGSFGQIPQSHFVFGRWLFNGEHQENEERWAERLLSGALIANAQAERSKPVLLTEHGNYATLNGTKFFCTGSIHADILAVTARRAGESEQTVGAFMDADAPGLTVHDDWDALGQRLTGSGRVSLGNVEVPVGEIRSFARALQLPGYGAFAQLLHSAIDVGIAGAALDEAFRRLRETPGSSGPSPASQALLHHSAGELQAQRFAAAAAFEKAGRGVDLLCSAEQDVDGVAVALDVAAAKTVTGSLTVDLASRIYELLGARAAGPGSGLDRYWRNLRTHTLHEKRREKLATLGRAWVTGEAPTLGPQL